MLHRDAASMYEAPVREDFEQWALARYQEEYSSLKLPGYEIFKLNELGKYETPTIERDWTAWLASRHSVEVVLPLQSPASSDITSRMHADNFNFAVTEAAVQIQDRGFKVVFDQPA